MLCLNEKKKSRGYSFPLSVGENKKFIKNTICSGESLHTLSQFRDHLQLHLVVLDLHYYHCHAMKAQIVFCLFVCFPC